MGLFTWVKPHQQLLPAEYRDLQEWQTKDVVEPELETLEITEDGRLIYVWSEREYVEDDKAFFGFWLKPTVEHRDELDFHGDMRFYTSNDRKEFIELKARFTEGRLQWIRKV